VLAAEKVPELGVSSLEEAGEELFTFLQFPNSQ
jgi:hypothetical protein